MPTTDTEWRVNWKPLTQAGIQMTPRTNKQRRTHTKGFSPNANGHHQRPNILRRLENGSAWTLKKGAASGETPRVDACSHRTGDAWMRLLIRLFGVRCSLMEREPPERKHLSRGRKRNQNGIPIVAASETGTVQTESRIEKYEKCSVKGSASSSLAKLKWFETTRQRGW